MKSFQLITTLLFLIYSNLAFPKTHSLPLNIDCHPTVNSNTAQYLVGYGSFIQTESKNRTYPYTGPNIPIIIKGYQRGWFHKGMPIGSSATYLGVIRDKSSEFNGVIFNLPADAIFLYDKREMGYCREMVSPKQIVMLNQQAIPKGQFWIYVSKPSQIAAPSPSYPITQSYADLFLSGCLEIQQTYYLKNFARDCIDTTSHWSPAWINDRFFPRVLRKPETYQSDTMEIDELLAEKTPSIFKQIKTA